MDEKPTGEIHNWANLRYPTGTETRGEIDLSAIFFILMDTFMCIDWINIYRGISHLTMYIKCEL